MVAFLSYRLVKVKSIHSKHMSTSNENKLIIDTRSAISYLRQTRVSSTKDSRIKKMLKKQNKYEVEEN